MPIEVNPGCEITRFSEPQRFSQAVFGRFFSITLVIHNIQEGNWWTP